MKIYLVGGAVRDQLLGRPVIEHDFVVVGASAQELLDQGFRPVGSDFPVFLHPQTHDEYALARTERKTGKGYTGFDCFADPSVTLEQDLARRDLTINAMAQECPNALATPAAHVTSKTIIDPFGGQHDLKNKILRHVSPAFAEDPVRILRAARFAARFPDFTVDSTTNTLMQQMVANGEVNALVAERVWKEFSQALIETDPGRFFEVLSECDALRLLFPELFNNPECFEYLRRSLVITSHESASFAVDTLENHPEKKTIPSHTALLRFCSLALALNKNEVTSLTQRLRPPSRFSELALLIATHKDGFQTLDIQDAEATVCLLERLDAYRRTNRFFDICRILHLNFEEAENSEEKIHRLQSAFEKTRNIVAEPFIQGGYHGEKIAQAIHQSRVESLSKGA